MPDAYRLQSRDGDGYRPLPGQCLLGQCLLGQCPSASCLLGRYLLAAALLIGAAVIPPSASGAPEKAACEAAGCLRLTVRAGREVPAFEPFAITLSEPVPEEFFAHAAASDIGGDGCTDLVGHISNGMLHVLHSDCRGHFTLKKHSGPFDDLPRYLLEFGDFDRDGQTDIFGFNEKQGHAVILRRESGDTFAGRRLSVAPDPYHRLSIVKALDVDGDGADELLGFAGLNSISYPDTRQVWVLLMNNGSAAFEVPIPACVLTEQHMALTAGAIDRSGKEYLFAEHGRSRHLSAVHVVSKGECGLYLWSAFPGERTARLQQLVADFTGDGLSDGLSVEVGGDWWFAHGVEAAFGIEAPLQMDLPDHEAIERVYALDVNGDSAADLVYRANGRLRAAISLPGEPLPGTAIEACDAALGMTSADGTLDGRLPPACTSLRLSRSGYQTRTIALAGAAGQMSVLLAPSPRRQPTGSVAGRPSQEHQPQVCSGYRITSVTGDGKWGRSPSACPGFYGVVGLDDGSGDGFFHKIDCCPLPVADVFGPDGGGMADSECPDGSAIIGVNFHAATSTFLSRHHAEAKVLCNVVNAVRYQLGPVTRGRYWGLGMSMRREETPIRHESLPAAIRHGIGRLGFDAWDVDGCVGDPPGSLLVAIGTGGCNTHLFRELQYRGTPGDPPAGTPVKMFPDCTTVQGIYTPYARCSSPVAEPQEE